MIGHSPECCPFPREVTIIRAKQSKRFFLLLVANQSKNFLLVIPAYTGMTNAGKTA